MAEEKKPAELTGLAESSLNIDKNESAKLPTQVQTPPAKQVVEAPDPDEDDLDDLDDMLDEFTPSKPEPKTASGPGRPQNSTAAAPAEEDEGISDEDFAKQLQDGMAELLGGLDSNPEMQAQFESMLKELGGLEELQPPATASSSKEPESAPTTSGGSKKSKKKAKKATTESAVTEESFQDTIRKTMERLNASGDNATAAAASDSTEDDLMAEMLKAMQASGLGDGEGGEEDFSKMLLGMMEQLTNKEILYEPMKELDDKFPEWMKSNEGKVKEDDMKRYKEQQVYVKEIVGRFEKKGYSDDNAADREYIVERMQKMQAAGSPPPDLVGDMAAAQEAFGAPEEGCPQQ